MNDIIKPQTSNLMRRRHGFTLIEILVVIGIIVILIAITVPVVSKVRKSAQVAGVQAQLNGLQGAITRYQQDHGALPGPLSNNDVRDDAKTTLFAVRTPRPDKFALTVTPARVTAAENLVLGLLGGLVTQPGTPSIAYDPSIVGNGPNNLNPAQPKKFPAYIEATNLSWRTLPNGDKTGDYLDNAGDADDTIIPEFVDTFPSPMPILYLRARKGAPSVPVTAAQANNNSVITNVLSTTAAGTRGHYDISQIVGYTGLGVDDRYIGEGKDIDPNDYKPDDKKPTEAGKLPHGLSTVDLAAKMDKGDPPTYEYPYNAYPYFKNPSSSTTDPQPRQKDGYILISAGVDRVYGTADDITNFGAVTE